MRKAINDNPMIQVAVVGVMIAAAGLLFMTRMKKEEPVVEPGAVAGAPVVAGAAPPADGVVSAVPLAAAPAATAVVSPEALKPGPGLPAAVVSAWESGDAVALLIVRESSTDDRLVRDAVGAISGRSDTTVFVVPANRIARYSRITQPVDVNRVPALVVLRPKRLSGKTPEATVTYGFRTGQGVAQAVQDALYSGKTNVPYFPG
jgi:hypothetical protein